MKLKYRYGTEAEIPAEFRGLYAERDGGWQLEAEGAVDKARLDEFRAHNVELRKQLEAQQQQYAGLDAEQAVKARAELEQQLARATAEREALQARYDEARLAFEVVEAAKEHGLRKQAVPDILARARQSLKLKEGQVRAYEADGRTERKNWDGNSPVTLGEWIRQQQHEAPHLFNHNLADGGADGGISGNRGGAVEAGDNPWKRETFNLTRQGALVRRDPAKARMLMAAAGVRG